jgi:LemA protein
MRFRKLMLVLPLALSACGYNRIQTLDEQAASSKQNIDVQLQRRADLIPNLVETVRGYAKHEEAVFTQVTAARAGLLSAIQSGDVERTAVATDSLNSAVGRMINVSVEAYPQLKADQQFLNLQAQLEGTENRIGTARNDYNAAVKEYNAYIRTFPQAITAKVTGAKARPYFEITSAGAREVPKVDFQKK